MMLSSFTVGEYVSSSLYLICDLPSATALVPPLPVYSLLVLVPLSLVEWIQIHYLLKIVCIGFFSVTVNSKSLTVRPLPL
jgi:hypothetical protein